MDQFEDQFLAENPEALGLTSRKKASSSILKPDMKRDFLHPAAGRRVHLHRRSGSRVSARNGRRSAPDPRRRSRSGAAHGARQAAHAEGHQPLGAGAARGGRAVRAAEEGPATSWTTSPIWAISKKARPQDLQEPRRRSETFRGRHRFCTRSCSSWKRSWRPLRSPTRSPARSCAPS